MRKEGTIRTMQKNISSGQTAKGLLTKFEQPVQNSLVVQKKPNTQNILKHSGVTFFA